MNDSEDLCAEQLDDGAEDSSSPQHTGGEQRGVKRSYSADCGYSDDFAFLSPDIVAGVLVPHVEFTDCMKLTSVNSCWGDLVRAGKFKVDNFDSKKVMFMKIKIAGFQRYSKVHIKTFLQETDSPDIIFNNAHIDPHRIRGEDLIKVYRCAAGAVKLTTTDTTLQGEHFEVLMENPRVHSVELDGLRSDSFKAVIDFCLKLKTNDKQLTFKHNIIRGWSESIDQFLENKGFIDNSDRDCRCEIVYDKGYECCCGRTTTGSMNHQIWQRLHPEDKTKVLEVLVQRPPEESAAKQFAEVRLYSHGYGIEEFEEDYEEDFETDFSINHVLWEKGIEEQKERLSCDGKMKNPENLKR